MKKLMTVLTALVLLVSASAFATTDSPTVTEKVKVAFEKDFKKASGVSWTKKSEYYFAWFTINNVTVSAAYNEEGELVCTSRDVEMSQLPLNVSLVLSQKYAGYTLPQNATELNYEGETHYYVTISNEKQALKLKFRPNGEVSVDEKIKIKK
ncbi:MAG: hypothetical protein H7334_08625 [Ferruginibacter sp.]|nr:hypothetical protein [Ferruginibacter sp.]